MYRDDFFESFLEQTSNFEAAMAVAKIGSSLIQTTISKFRIQLA
jgi:hypothetical protein